MPTFGPIRRRELIAAFRRLGFDGPYAGGNHEDMVKDTPRVIIPNPHRGEIGREFLARLPRQAGITREEWGVLRYAIGLGAGAKLPAVGRATPHHRAGR